MRAVLFAVYLLLVTPIMGSWWAVGSQVITNPELVCKKTSRLRGQIEAICKDKALLLEIVKGVEIGTKECQYQFRNRRWNCTTLSKSLKKVLMRDTREAGFVNALTAAGVTYSVTRACTMGNLVECSCDKSSNKGMHRVSRKRTDKPEVNLGETEWEWGGCGDNVNFGYKKSKAFMNFPYRRKKKSDMKTLIRLHNNGAGRLAVKNYMHTDCKCHGLSGSCTLRTCWKKMPTFREVGNRLKERFDGAAKVIPSNDGRNFIPDGNTIKPPGRGDLVYSQDSPDFCKLNTKSGSLGTYGRQCNATSPGVDGCELLCCGRGFDTRLVREKVNCECRFRWCCEVTCKTCNQKPKRCYASSKNTTAPQKSKLSKGLFLLPGGQTDADEGCNLSGGWKVPEARVCPPMWLVWVVFFHCYAFFRLLNYLK